MYVSRMNVFMYVCIRESVCNVCVYMCASMYLCLYVYNYLFVFKFM